MKQLVALIFCLISFSAFAQVDNVISPPVNTVSLQLQAQQWVQAKTAKVSVEVNAALNNEKLSNVYSNIRQNLNRLAPQADWHITQFNRSQDNTGLEKVTVEAEVRLPQNALTNIRDQAKAISQPGATYTINDIAFSPSFTEIQAAKSALRVQIYQQALNEVNQLNKIYVGEHFYLHQLNFVEPWVFNPQPLVKTTALLAMPADDNSLSVGKEVTITANATFAAQP